MGNGVASECGHLSTPDNSARDTVLLWSCCASFFEVHVMGGNAPVCVLRRYKDRDSLAVGEMLSQAVMETVMDYFWATVFSEVFPQIALLIIAISYIGLGFHFYYCLVGIPVAVFVIYVVIWLAHITKSMELGQEVANISQFQQDSDKGFWVAEVLEAAEANELDALINKTKKVEYLFVNEAEAAARGLDITGRRHVVGLVGVTKSLRGGMKAWLRYITVKKAYRRRGIAMRLLDEVIQFCIDHCKEGIELTTTECHYKAREMFYKKGFEVQHTYYKYYLNVKQPMYMFLLPLKPPKAELSEISAS